jgi:hypothetical protein
MAKIPPQQKGQRQEVADLRRGDIYLCSFDPTVGHEIKKTRPALVIQNDIGNRFSPLTIVAAITSNVPPVPYPVVVVIAPTPPQAAGWGFAPPYVWTRSVPWTGSGWSSALDG